MKAHNSFRRQRGFNLIEVLIAVVILSVGLLALASLQIAMIRSSAEAKTQTIAMAIAKDKIESLRAYSSPAAYTNLADEAAVTLADSGGNQGGVDFTRTTNVYRYVYDGTSNAFELRATDNEADATLLAVTGNTYKPGKEFKRVEVLVQWNDAAGGPQKVQLEDAIGNIDPSDTLDLLAPSSNNAPRAAIVLRDNPGDTAGVIPIAIGNGTSTAATNPTPEVNANNSGSKVVETLFEVLTYAGLNGSADDEIVKTQSRVETSVVSCQCDYSEKPDTADAVKGYRPTYWNGNRYAAPERASYLVPAGEEALPNNAIQQSEKCFTCCRDHHDPSTNEVKFSPRRANHTHNAVSGNVFTATTTGAYAEVCRLIRVDGIFRVAADVYNDRENLVATDNTGATPYPGSDDGEGEDQYAEFVLSYLDSRIVLNSSAATFNSKLRVRSGADQDAQDAIEASITTLEDAAGLNAPTLLEIERSADYKWLHSRGLYVDYLEEDARDAIVAAKAGCKGTDDLPADTVEEKEACVLPLMPFTSINTSEVAFWTVSSEPELTVSNSDFKLVTDGTGDTDPIKGKVTPDIDADSNDDPHPDSQSTILDSNAGLAARDIAVHSDEIAINDKQVFDITAGPPVGDTTGIMYGEITAASGVLPSYASTQAPQMFFKFKASAPTEAASCDAVAPSSTPGYPNPYTCQDSLVGGAGEGVIQSYNYPPAALLNFTGTATCTKSNGTGAISVSMNRNDRPWCKNLDVTAQLSRANVIVQTGTNKVELNDGLTTEITTFDFSGVLTGDKIIYTFTDETPNPYPSVTSSDYTCTYTGNSGSQSQATVNFQWQAQCPSQ